MGRGGLGVGKRDEGVGLAIWRRNGNGEEIDCLSCE